MLEGVLANMLRVCSMGTFYMLEGALANMLTVCSMETFYMLEGVLANMLRQSARWRPFTCWREC